MSICLLTIPNKTVPPLKHIGGSDVSLNPAHTALSTPVLSSFPYGTKINMLKFGIDYSKMMKSAKNYLYIERY